MPSTLLLVDDDHSILSAVSRTLTQQGYKVIVADCGRDCLARLGKTTVDMVLLDLHLPDQDGLSVLAAMRAADHDVPVLMMSGEGTVESAVKALRLGAVDFLQKPVAPERLLVTVGNALRYERLARSHAELEEEARPFDGLLGESARMEEIRRLIEKAAPTEGRVLITGENGTGKELVARGIHRHSNRASQPFVRMNCAAIPGELIESVLFGHEKGAFTGAVAARRGKFELADQGTLFLDEIGEMTPAMQSKVLRALQEGEVERVGGAEPIEVDTRIVAATNRNLEEMMAKGTFREDLYYRLNVIRIQTVPLRQHREDIPHLATTFLEAAQKKNGKPPIQFHPEALKLLASHSYPGNVRELQNLVERLVILADDDSIGADQVQMVLAPAAQVETSSGYRKGVPFKELVNDAQRDILEAALEEHQWRMAETARSLGLERSHLYKKCRALGVRIGAAPVEEAVSA